MDNEKQPSFRSLLGNLFMQIVNLLMIIGSIGFLILGVYIGEGGDYSQGTFMLVLSFMLLYTSDL